jgi:ubiquinone/menaquinone biosynthesis C-methylase UbiE
MDEMQLSSKKAVLDAGAGTGNLAVLIAKAGAQVVGIDSSEIGLKIFKEKLPGSEAILHDLRHPIPIEDNKFDYICCVNTIFAIDPIHRDKICGEFFRLLKPGGKIIMTNLVDGYHPLRIYMNHISEEVKHFGWRKAFMDFIHLIGPALRMFRYNRRMKKNYITSENTWLFKDHGQENLLRNSGFSNVSGEKRLFAGQAILSSGFKV